MLHVSITGKCTRLVVCYCMMMYCKANNNRLFLPAVMLYCAYPFILWLSITICIVYVYPCDAAFDVRDDTLVTRSTPGLNAPKKLWWAKEITPDYHLAGRLTERQIKYAADGGFKSIASLFKYGNTEGGDFGGEYLPTTYEEKKLVEQAGLQFEVILDPKGPGGGDWATVGAVEQLAAKLPSLKKPVLLHCDRAYTIAFVLMMHMANCSRYDPTYTPQVNSDRFYRMAAMMGIDFTMDFTMEVVSQITGEPIPKNPPKPDAVPYEWYDFWLAHHLYKNWFTSGQIRNTHVTEIKNAGFKHVVNMRLGLTHKGKPSQETVTLINVKDSSITYGDTGNRQDEAALRAMVLDPSKDSSAISPSSTLNFESRNEGEFGDDIGFNEEFERKAFENSGLKYHHMPVDVYGEFSPEVFGQYKERLMALARTGEPVLLQCAIGKRVAWMGVLAQALVHEKDLNWALKRLRELGHEVSPTNRNDVYSMLSYWLDSKNFDKSEKEEL